MSKIAFLRQHQLSPDGRLVKKVLIEGRGADLLPRPRSRILYKCEVRDSIGKLINHSDRNSITCMKTGEPGNIPEYERILMTMRIGETALAVMRLPWGLYAQIVGSLKTEHGEEETLYVTFAVQEIVYNVDTTAYADLAGLMGIVEYARVVCRNYIEIAANNLQLYRYARAIYVKVLAQLQSPVKKVEQKASPEERDRLRDTIQAFWLNKALTELRLKSFAEARESAEKALAISERKSLKAWYRLGVACFGLGQKPMAYNAFAEVKSREPENAAIQEYAGFMEQFEKSKQCATGPKKGYHEFWKRYAEEEAKEKREAELRRKLERKEERQPETMMDLDVTELQGIVKCPFEPDAGDESDK